jgi:hypothetical protein
LGKFLKKLYKIWEGKDVNLSEFGAQEFGGVFLDSEENSKNANMSCIEMQP